MQTEDTIEMITLSEAETKFKVGRSALKRLARVVPGAKKDTQGWHLPADIIIVKGSTGVRFSFPGDPIDLRSKTTKLVMVKKVSDKEVKGIQALSAPEVLEDGLRAFLYKIGIEGLLTLPKARQALSHALIHEIWEQIKS